MNREISIELVLSVAPLISGAWRYNQLITEAESCQWRQRIVITDDAQPGRRIDFIPTAKHGNKRFQIYGRLNSHSSRTWHSAEITVSQSRHARAIAADINRRLIPGYLETWQETDINNKKYDRESAEHLQKIEMIRRLVPRFRGSNCREITDRTTDFRFDHGNIRMHRTWEKHCLELDLSFNEMVQVLHFVKSMRNPHKL